jgi:hypothetical protein
MVKMVLSISNDVKGFVSASPLIDLRDGSFFFDMGKSWTCRAQTR